VVLGLTNVLALVIVEAAIIGPVWRLGLLRCQVEVVDRVIIENLLLFEIKQVAAIMNKSFSRVHRELRLLTLLILLQQALISSDLRKVFNLGRRRHPLALVHL